jgi:hypothetical protein
MSPLSLRFTYRRERDKLRALSPSHTLVWEGVDSFAGRGGENKIIDICIKTKPPASHAGGQKTKSVYFSVTIIA